MTTKKYLSDKKVTQQTISISPSLKEWIERYIRVMHKKNPDDVRYKSVSAFYCEVMDNVLRIFKKGKTLDDFKMMMDTKIKNFYDKITFRAVIPYYEEVVYLNKYQELNLKELLNLFMIYRNQFSSEGELTMNKVIEIFDRFKSFMLSNNISKDVVIDIEENKCIIQYFGIYPNTHYDFSKWIAGALAILGLKIKKVVYSKNYTRLDLEKTYLLNDINSLEKERIELFYGNISYFTNYYKMINDKDPIHLWLKIARTKKAIISFKEKEKYINLIDEVINDIEKYSTYINKIPTILKLFEHFGWIHLINLEEISFICNLSNHHNIEKEIIKDIFRKLDLKIEKKENMFYLG